MKKIFLVEDEQGVRKMMRDTVDWASAGVVFAGEAGDGESALPMIYETRPDILITDIRMPFMDGLALAENVRREFPDTRVIIVSGYDDFKYAQQAIRLGVDDYILKPVTPEKLLRAIADVLRKKTSPRGAQTDRPLSSIVPSAANAETVEREIVADKAARVVSLAKDYIAANFTNADLSLGDAARHAKVSPNYLSTLFTKETGETFSEYLNKTRVKLAMTLLKSTPLPAAEIALRTGYNDQQYFFRIFKKVIGITPKEYRNM